MNQLSNHDHSRFLTRTNQIVGRIGTAGAKMAEFGVNYGIFREAIMVQMTWPGAPTLYYGRLPCYDFTPVISPAFGSSLRKRLGH